MAAPGEVRCSIPTPAAVASRRFQNLAAVNAYFGQPEVKNFGVTALGDEDIGGLDVAMNNVLGVRRFERVRDFDGQSEKQAGFERAEGDAVFQRRAFQKLHRDKGLVVVLSDFVDGADVGMVQRGGGTGFASKSLQGLRVVRKFVGKKFQGDEAPELGVFSFVNYAHPAAAQLVHYAIVRDGLPDHVCLATESGNVRRDTEASQSWGVVEEVYFLSVPQASTSMKLHHRPGSAGTRSVIRNHETRRFLK